MNIMLQSQIFFFISSIGFIVLGILTAIVLICILRSFNSLSRILKRAEKDIDSIGDTTKEILEDARDSMIFRFLFRGKKRKSK